eukprot:jgi/Botrbrau1/11150/Bobra.182_2s0005.1
MRLRSAVSRTVPLILKRFSGGATAETAKLQIQHLGRVCPEAVEKANGYLGRKPFVVSGAFAGWPVSSWTFTDMAAVLGDAVVPVEISKGGADYRDHFVEVPMSNVPRLFQADVHVPLGYLLKHIMSLEEGPSKDPGLSGAQTAVERAVPPEEENVLLYLAQKDVHEVLPEVANKIGSMPFRDVFGRLHRCSVWLGPRGTVTPLHRDPYHNVFCQVLGKKLFRIYDPASAPFLDLYEWPLVLRNTSRLHNIDSIEADYYEVELHAGEMIHLPKKWFHHVEALSGSFSLSFWWP